MIMIMITIIIMIMIIMIILHQTHNSLRIICRESFWANSCLMFMNIIFREQTMALLTFHFLNLTNGVRYMQNRWINESLKRFFFQPIIITRKYIRIIYLFLRLWIRWLKSFFDSVGVKIYHLASFRTLDRYYLFWEAKANKIKQLSNLSIRN